MVYFVYQYVKHGKCCNRFSYIEQVNVICMNDMLYILEIMYVVHIHDLGLGSCSTSDKSSFFSVCFILLYTIGEDI